MAAALKTALCCLLVAAVGGAEMSSRSQAGGLAPSNVLMAIKLSNRSTDTPTNGPPACAGLTNYAVSECEAVNGCKATEVSEDLVDCESEKCRSEGKRAASCNVDGELEGSHHDLSEDAETESRAETTSSREGIPDGASLQDQSANDTHVCASGKFWPNGPESSTNLFPGSTSPCVNCPVGWFKNGTNSARNCTLCPRGQYSAYPGQGQCDGCNAGFFGCVAGNPCDECPSGWFQDERASTDCDTCDSCPAGYRVAQECQPSQDVQCLECSVGRVTDSHSLAECVDCQQGKYADQRALPACKDCVEGTTFTDENGASFCKNCTVCYPGWYAQQPCTAIRDTRCSTCSWGRFSDTPQVEARCKACPTGFYQNKEGGTSCMALDGQDGRCSGVDSNGNLICPSVPTLKEDQETL